MLEAANRRQVARCIANAYTAKAHKPLALIQVLALVDMANNGTPKSPANDGPTPWRRRRPIKCAKGCYHFGAALLVAGLIVAIIGTATNNLFQIVVYDNRRPSQFHHIVAQVGLFDIDAVVKDNNGLETELEYPPVLTGMYFLSKFI